ncbi:MAG: hypothetical protein R3D30_07300 [Hyphomicrobiales bacterium]
MLPVRQSKASAAIAVLLIAWALVFLLLPQARAEDATPVCGEFGLALLASPSAPWKGAPLRVIFATEKPLDGQLLLITPKGQIAAQTADRKGGPPYFWSAEVAAPEAGTWHAKLTRSGATTACREITRNIEVAGKQPPGPRDGKGVWPIHGQWNRSTENLYSAWIETLFDAPLSEDLSWKALDEVLHDQSRNVLFNHLGLREDDKGASIRPDCADVPYFLRAYFAFKMGLPFGYMKCSRGDGGVAPKCTQWWNTVKEEPAETTIVETRGRRVVSNGLFGAVSVQAPVRRKVVVSKRPKGLVPGFHYYLASTIADAVHSGNGRTAGDDDDTDYYPVPLTQDALRPGTVYADPYGHVLTLVKRVPQTKEGAGVFLAVDGQPDGTVARKRFWRGNFLFAQDPKLGGPGFKHFRPIVMDKNGTLRRLTNAEIAKDPDYGDFSLEQSTITVEEFYDHMDDAMSPAPLDPVLAMKEVITSLEEQVKARVTSVENGREFLAGGPPTVTMPDGAEIFETSGPWEDFATPSRDLRLLIAIDVVRHFPDHVARRPERYKMPPGKTLAEVKAQLLDTFNSELATRKFTYTRSDGSSWTLTLDDVLVRIGDLEMAYNINDCVELRWGALEGSEEASTCKRRAPAAQRKKMASDYRPWFSERRRPPRG